MIITKTKRIWKADVLCTQDGKDYLRFGVENEIKSDLFDLETNMVSVKNNRPLK